LITGIPLTGLGTDGKAGTVESIWLDEMHGLRISVRGHDGKWPISTVKFANQAV
jgi:hypothetical protein